MGSSLIPTRNCGDMTASGVHMEHWHPSNASCLQQSASSPREDPVQSDYRTESVPRISSPQLPCHLAVPVLVEIGLPASAKAPESSLCDGFNSTQTSQISAVEARPEVHHTLAQNRADYRAAKGKSTTGKKVLPKSKACMAVKTVQLADPLPQKGAALPRPRILVAGLVVDDCRNRKLARGDKFAAMSRRSSSREPETDDPNLACHLWDRKLQRPKALRR